VLAFDAKSGEKGPSFHRSADRSVAPRGPMAIDGWNAPFGSFGLPQPA